MLFCDTDSLILCILSFYRSRCNYTTKAQKEFVIIMFFLVYNKLTVQPNAISFSFNCSASSFFTSFLTITGAFSTNSFAYTINQPSNPLNSLVTSFKPSLVISRISLITAIFFVASIVASSRSKLAF